MPVELSLVLSIIQGLRSGLQTAAERRALVWQLYKLTGLLLTRYLPENGEPVYGSASVISDELKAAYATLEREVNNFEETADTTDEGIYGADGSRIRALIKIVKEILPFILPLILA